MKSANKVSPIFDSIIVFLAALAGILLCFIILSVTYGIVMRYFWGRPPIWITEVCEDFLLWIAFFGVAWVLKKEGHVTMDFVLNQLPPRTQCLINTITSIIGVIVFFVVAWYGAKMTITYFQLGDFIAKPLRIPYYAVIWVIPLGCFLFSIQFLRRAYSYLRSWRQGI